MQNGKALHRCAAVALRTQPPKDAAHLLTLLLTLVSVDNHILLYCTQSFMMINCFILCLTFTHIPRCSVQSVSEMLGSEVSIITASKATRPLRERQLGP